MSAPEHTPERKDTTPGKNPRRKTRKSPRRSRSVVSAADRAKVRAAISALPPLSESEVDALCEVIRVTRARWEREDERKTGE
jgi:hypothetical protein